MKNIAEIDKNLAIETSIEREGLCFYDAEQAPFQIYGIFKENGMFRRMPEEIAKTVSEGVYNLHTNTAGGRVRFITDSPYVAIKTEYIPGKMPHFATTGSCGFDMYYEYDGMTRYEGTFVPPYDVENGYESVLDFTTCHERVVTINFPLYSSVKKIYVGLKEGSVLKPAPGYRVEKPVVYYGSSITQGGCASKPGSSYQSILSRRFDCDYINLGFSGSAKGEKEMADYIKELDMSVFVMDYDHNAPSAEHLEHTHSRMFQIVRSAQPHVPILIMTSPKYYRTEIQEERMKIIHNTYMAAKNDGDKNVYFLDGRKLMEMVEDNGTVDRCHPTDSGFWSMACAIGQVFEEIFKVGERNVY
ncbi:MAG: hypothetical protein IKK03_13550 [Lachnospiraceae bacterium]|nr:hypothetical protein [Lachnospiraceae bacterium]